MNGIQITDITTIITDLADTNYMDTSPKPTFGTIVNVLFFCVKCTFGIAQGLLLG